MKWPTIKSLCSFKLFNRIKDKPIEQKVIYKREQRTLSQLKKDEFKNLTELEQKSIVKVSNLLQDLQHKAEHVWPKQFHDSIDIFLKNYGWYVRIDMSFAELIPFIKQGNKAVDNYFIEHFSNGDSLEHLKTLAIMRFPHRERAIQQAFNAHIGGQYELSVPAFLILSEGLFRELSGADIFSSNSKSKKEKNAFIKELQKSPISFLMSYSIDAGTNGEILGFSFNNNKDMSTFPNVLHRNRIVHGYDTEYGTKVNSFKALSQFEFVTISVYNGVHGLYEC